MKSKLSFFLTAMMLLAGCGYEITKKETNTGKNAQIETVKKDGGKDDNSKVELNDGKGNDIKVKNDDGDQIEINGDKGDKTVKISKNGVSVEDENKGDKDNLVVDSVGTEKTYPCNNRNITVNGSANKVTLTGECQSLVVNGAGQTVTVEKSGSINVNGMNNKVFYENGDPDLHKAGVNNSIEKK